MGVSEEIWKDIEDYEGLYQVSNTGKVMRNNMILIPYIGTDKYYYVGLSKRSKVTKFKIHRLVAQAFIPNYENKPTVDHINRDRLDNSVENLRWATYSEQRSNQSSGEVPVYLISKDYTDLYFESQAEAARFLKTDVRNVNSALHGHSKTTHGYEVEYGY